MLFFNNCRVFLDVFSGPSVKKEESSVDRWTKDQTLNLSETLPLEEDHPSVCPSPDRQTQVFNR